MFEYIIVRGYTLQELEERINKLAKKGFYADGTLVLDNADLRCYIQRMCKKIGN